MPAYAVCLPGGRRRHVVKLCAHVYALLSLCMCVRARVCACLLCRSRYAMSVCWVVCVRSCCVCYVLLPGRQLCLCVCWVMFAFLLCLLCAFAGACNMRSKGRKLTSVVSERWASRQQLLATSEIRERPTMTATALAILLLMQQAILLLMQQAILLKLLPTMLRTRWCCGWLATPTSPTTTSRESTPAPSKRRMAALTGAVSRRQSDPCCFGKVSAPRSTAPTAPGGCNRSNAGIRGLPSRGPQKTRG